MVGTMICILEISSQMPNHWPNVWNAIFEIPDRRVPTALEMSLLHILRSRTKKQEHLKKKRGGAAFPDCQVKYSFVIEVSCSAFGKAGITCSFLQCLKRKVRHWLQINPPNFELK